MVDLPRNAQGKRSGLRRASSHEIVSESRSASRGALPGLLADLKSLAQRGGTAIGEAYAIAASSFLTHLERVEDRRAERRFRRRSQAVRGADRSALELPPSPKPPTLTARSSRPI